MANLINVHTGEIHADVNELAQKSNTALFCKPGVLVSWDDYAEVGAAPITCPDCQTLIWNIEHVASVV